MNKKIVITPATQSPNDGTEVNLCGFDDGPPMTAADRAWREEHKKDWLTSKMAKKFHEDTQKMASNYVWGLRRPDRITTGHEGEE